VAQPAGFQTTLVGGYDGAALQALSVDTAGRTKVVLADVTGSPLAQVTNKSLDGNGPNNGPAVWPFNLLYNGAFWDRLRTPVIWKDVNAVAVVAGTGFTAWTPGAGKKFRLMGYALSSSAAAAIIFGDNAVGAVLHRTPLLAAAGVFAGPPMGNGQLSAAANNVLKIDVSVNSTLTGYLFGTEE
jgi:hypothetical protein